ncbi:MAG: hypothetical protein ACK6DX_09995 [Acidobacteriota bacterium]
MCGGEWRPGWGDPGEAGSDGNGGTAGRLREILGRRAARVLDVARDEGLNQVALMRKPS